MLLTSLAVFAAGLLILVWSANVFIDGAAATARRLGMSPLLIGMLLVGFGTSLPEMIVSAIAASQNVPELALGNAYGSNIVNICVILGVTALVSPVLVESAILRREFPVLVGIILLSFALVIDGSLSRIDALILLVVFVLLMIYSIRRDLHAQGDKLAQEAEENYATPHMSLKKGLLLSCGGLLGLVVSSRFLVWSAVSLARAAGLSDLVIGLTIVAFGTSLPELAASIAATRKQQHDIALGNVLGSNLFNLLAVIGIAGTIHPLGVERAVLMRDFPMMVITTLLLWLFCKSWRGRPGRISRIDGVFLLILYAGYLVYLGVTAIGAK